MIQTQMYVGYFYRAKTLKYYHLKNIFYCMVIVLCSLICGHSSLFEWKYSLPAPMVIHVEIACTLEIGSVWNVHWVFHTWFSSSSI